MIITQEMARTMANGFQIDRYFLNHSLNQYMNPYSRPLSYICPNLLSVLMNPSISILSKTLLAQLSIMLTHLSLYYHEVLINLSNYTSANWLIWICLLKLCKLLEGWFFGLSQLFDKIPLSNIHITWESLSQMAQNNSFSDVYL